MSIFATQGQLPATPNGSPFNGLTGQIEEDGIGNRWQMQKFASGQVIEVGSGVIVSGVHTMARIASGETPDGASMVALSASTTPVDNTDTTFNKVQIGGIATFISSTDASGVLSVGDDIQGSGVGGQEGRVKTLIPPAAGQKWKVLVATTAAGQSVLARRLS